MIRDLDRLTAHDLRRPRRRRRHLRADDRLRRGAARPVGRAHRARRLRQRRVVQSPADDSRRAALPAVARHRAARASRSASGATIARIAPQAVRPLPFAVPLYRSLMRGKMAMRAGFAARSPRRRRIAIAACPPSHRLPGGRVVSRSHAAQRFPGPAAAGADRRRRLVRLRHDRARSPHVLVRARRGRARRRARQPRRGDRAARRRRRASPACSARDAIGPRTLEIAARLTVNATGGRVDRPAEAARHRDRHPDAEGDEPRHEARRRRRGARRPVAVRAGICFSCRGAIARCSAPGSPTGPAIRTTPASPERDVAAFIAELNQAFPALDLHAGRRHAGASRRRAGASCAAAASALEGHEQIRDHATQGIRGPAQRRRHEIHDGARASPSASPTALFAKLNRSAGAVPDRDDAAAGRQPARHRPGDRRRAARVRRGAADRHDSASDRRVRIALSRRAGDRRHASGLADARSRPTRRSSARSWCWRRARRWRRRWPTSSSAGRRSARSAIPATPRSRAPPRLSAASWAGPTSAGAGDRRVERSTR